MAMFFINKIIGFLKVGVLYTVILGSYYNSKNGVKITSFWGYFNS